MPGSSFPHTDTDTDTDTDNDDSFTNNSLNFRRTKKANVPGHHYRAFLLNLIRRLLARHPVLLSFPGLPRHPLFINYDLRLTPCNHKAIANYSIHIFICLPMNLV